MVHLHVHSAFSLLDGTASVEALVERAAQLGYGALALTDRDSVSGVVALHRAARKHGLQPIAGAELTLEDASRLTVLATGPRGFAGLCRVLTDAHLRSPRGQPRARLAALAAEEGLIALGGCRQSAVAQALLQRRPEAAEEAVRRLCRAFPGRFYLEIERASLPGESALEEGLLQLARHFGCPAVATANVHHIKREDVWLHDLLTCVRVGVVVDQMHPERPLNGERFLASPAEMARRFADRPGLWQRTAEVAGRCASALPRGRRLYPAFALPAGETAQGKLSQLVHDGARARYGAIRPPVAARLQQELATIFELGFAEYFLIVWDVVRHAREQGIRVAGRGSAADSAVAYCLGITEVDAVARGLLFARFLNRERAERPDIDLDFDHRARDRVADYLFDRYGEEHVAGVATYQTYQARSAVRDIGQALGFPRAELDQICRRLPHVPADAIAERWEMFPELRRAPVRPERLARMLQACAGIAGLPRHLGTHLGGLVVSRDPITDVAPRQRAAKGIAVVPFDKLDVEDLGFLKFDLLSLRTFAALSEAYRQAPELERAGAADDPAAYRLISSARTIGVFQLESPAQRALQGRLGAGRFDDVVHALALIRPGPIKGDMVEPYLRRRRGSEPVRYAHPKLKPILEGTYGVVLFQEQVISIATELVGFTPGEADQLRRVMTHARSAREMEAIRERFMVRAQERDLGQEQAQSIFQMLQGYASYGFPEAHSAAFAHTALRTAQLSARRPAAFFAALLSMQPMGYYPPHILVAEARRRGVRFAPPDVNRSQENYSIEADGRVRIGLVAVRGLGEADRREIVRRRQADGYASLEDFARRSGLSVDRLRQLAFAGAFDRFDPNRRRLLWRIGTLAAQFGLFSKQPPPLPDFDPEERFWRQEAVLGLCGPSVLMRSLRADLRAQGICSVRHALAMRHGTRLRVAGVLFRPHRPPTRSGRTVVFFMLEDETGLLDCVAMEDVYQKDGALMFGERPDVLGVAGRVQRRGRSVAIRAEEIFAVTPGKHVQ